MIGYELWSELYGDWMNWNVWETDDQSPTVWLWSVNEHGSANYNLKLVWSMIRNQWTLGKIVESMYVISEPVQGTDCDLKFFWSVIRDQLTLSKIMEST